jgi:hypothetical protein
MTTGIQLKPKLINIDNICRDLKAAGINSLEKYNVDPQPQPSSLSLPLPINHKKEMKEKNRFPSQSVLLRRAS